MVLPPVTREDTKRMSTAEICLYLKARKFHTYDVGVARRALLCVDISACI